MLVATTPQSKPWLKKFVKRPGTSVTHSTTWDNAANLPAVRLAQLKEEWEGRTLALQEIEGLFVESNAEALFREEWFQHHEVPNEMIERVAIGVDPSGGADEIGIVACALLTDDRFAVLTDRSLKSTPAKWGEAVVKLADEFEALDIETQIVCESNYGGPLSEDNIRDTARLMAEQGRRADDFIRIRMVTASKGKTVRIGPISGLYEQGRVLHRPGLSKLEAEELKFTPDWN